MTEYKRWTDKNWKQFDCSEMYRAFAELEDKIENGTLIELPDMRVIPEDVHGSLIQIVWFNSFGEIEFQYFNIKRKAEAEAKLEELKRGQK